MLALSSGGAYAWLPLGLRMLRKLQQHIRRLLEQAGTQEIALPMLTPLSLWEGMDPVASEDAQGLRLDLAGPERKTRYLLGGWQEPVLAHLLAGWLASYRNLPLVLFQRTAVCSPERGPSGSLAEAPGRPAVQLYGFYDSAESLHRNYQNLLQRCEELVLLLELPYWVAQKESPDEEPAHQMVVKLESDPKPAFLNQPVPSEGNAQAGYRVGRSGMDGQQPVSGKESTRADGEAIRTAQAPDQSPWEQVAFCDTCGYTAVRDWARIGGRPAKPVPARLVLGGQAEQVQPDSSPQMAQAEQGHPEGSKCSEEPVRCVPTPGARTIAEVTAFLGRPAQQFLKTLVYLADGQPVAVLVRGDHEASEPKIRRAFGVRRFELADPATVENVTGAPVGFSGPIGLKQAIPLWADWDVQQARNVVVGANQADAHFVGVCVGRDFQPDFFADLRVALPGDPCPQCSAVLQMGGGMSVVESACWPVEWTDRLGLRFHDAQERLRPVRMSRWQIDLARLLTAFAARSHDSAGLIWPERLAPWDIVLVCLSVEDPRLMEAAGQLYAAWQAAGLEVLLDDRDLRPGVKFYDADLLGIPWRVVLGPRHFQEGQVEVKHRRTGQKETVPLAEAARIMIEKVRSAKNQPLP